MNQPEKTKNKKAKARIVFDLDGTLVDSAVGIRHIANTVLAQENREPLSLELTISFIGNGISTFIERMSKARDLAASDHQRLFEEYNRQDALIDQVSETYPGVIDCLTTLRKEGYAIGLCTNKLTDATMAMLSDLDIRPYFDCVVCGDTLPTRKPDPQMLTKAFDEMPAGKNIYVGDSEVDAETAQRASVPFLLFTEGYRKTPVEDVPHTQIFSSYQALKPLIDSMLES